MGRKVLIRKKNRKERRIKIEENGSYTVEAAFVVPIALGIAFLILYILFLQHDRVMLQSNLDNILFLTAEGNQDCLQEYKNDLREFLWCMEVKDAGLSDGLIWIQGNVSAEAFWEIPVLSYFTAGKQEIALSESFGKLQPEEVIRYGADRLENGFKEREGEEK